MKNILTIIMTKMNDFSHTEQKIAKFIINNSEKIQHMSIQEAAKEVQVSTATIIRFCHSLDISGYSDLKLHLSASQNLNDQENNYKELIIGEDIDAIINKLSSRCQNTIIETGSQLNKQELTKIIEDVHNVDNIEIFGIGASAIAGEDLFQKMIRLGLHVNNMQDFHLAITKLVSIEASSSLLIVISNSGKTQEIINLLKIAKKQDIKTLLITSNSNSAAVELASNVLISQNFGEPKIRIGATTSLISQLFIIDVLLYSYISKYYKEFDQTLNKSVEILSEYKK